MAVLLMLEQILAQILGIQVALVRPAQVLLIQLQERNIQLKPETLFGASQINTELRWLS